MFKYDEGFKDRFSVVIQSRKGVKKAAEVAGVVSDQVARWRDGLSRPSLFPIANLCGSVQTLGWLLTGVQQDAVKVKDSLIDVPIECNLEDYNHSTALIIRNNVGMPFALPFNRDYLRSLGVEPNNVKGVYASGDSMMPTIADKTFVLVDATAQDLKKTGIYALIINNTLYIRRVQKQFDGSILLISDNKEHYAEQSIAAADETSISIIGKAFWTEKVL
jgi:hypothetical protein